MPQSLLLDQKEWQCHRMNLRPRPSKLKYPHAFSWDQTGRQALFCHSCCIPWFCGDIGHIATIPTKLGHATPPPGERRQARARWVSIFLASAVHPLRGQARTEEMDVAIHGLFICRSCFNSFGPRERAGYVHDHADAACVMKEG